MDETAEVLKIRTAAERGAQVRDPGRRRAFVGDSVVSILSAILRDEPKPAAQIIHGLPRDPDKILTRCLRKDPDRRYQHAGDLKIDLQQA